MICENCKKQISCKNIMNIYETYCYYFMPNQTIIDKWKTLKQGDTVYYVFNSGLKTYTVHETRILKQLSQKDDEPLVKVKLKISGVGEYIIDNSQLNLFYLSKEEIFDCLRHKSDCRKIEFIPFSEVTEEDIDFLF